MSFFQIPLELREFYRENFSKLDGFDEAYQIDFLIEIPKKKILKNPTKKKFEVQKFLLVRLVFLFSSSYHFQFFNLVQFLLSLDKFSSPFYHNLFQELLTLNLSN